MTLSQEMMLERDVAGSAEDLDMSGAWEGGAFPTFFEFEYERMMKTLTLACGDRHVAEELTQEAMARAFEHWDRVSRASSPTAYVYRIAFNLLRRWRRRAAISRRLTVSRIEGEDPAAEVTSRLHARQTLERLPTAQREALVLIDWSGMSVDEAARVLGVGPSSVRARLSRGRATMRGLLEDSDVE